MTEIYLVRHCFSLTNNSKLLAGWYDTDISEKGAEQLELLAERFRDIKLDKVYVSPLIRARKTAAAVNKYPEAEVVVDERFKELWIGELECKTIDDMTEEQRYAWQYDITKFHSEGEEPQHAYNRFVEGFLEAAKANDGKTIAIVAHGAVLRMFSCYARGAGLEMYNKINGMRNTAVNLVRFSEEKGIEIVFEDDVSHLESRPELITSGWKFNPTVNK